MGRPTGSNDVVSGTLSVEHDKEGVRWEAKKPLDSFMMVGEC